jgi:carboxyl-terminal processing protease
VRAAFMVSPGTGYVRLQDFSETTDEELSAALRNLSAEGMRQLVLDLRENPGGPLLQAIKVSSHFLHQGQMVVYTRGRIPHSDDDYRVQTEGDVTSVPLVVLVNRDSASASEIVTGAMQDHDRGIIVGETTFGKALVQSVYEIANHAAVALTTAHYYTPSGRLIQRDYSNISFLDYYTHTNLDQKNLQDIKTTDSGRTVYGGGGITPDEKWEAPLLNPFQISLRRKDSFFNFSAKYFGARDTKLPQGWEPDAAIVDQFHAFIKDKGVEFMEADFTANRDWIKRELKREMYITAFSTDESNRVAIEQDPMVQKAIESMPKAKELLTNAKSLLVKRMKAQESIVAAAK